MDQLLFSMGDELAQQKAQEESWVLTLGLVWVSILWMA